VEGCWGDYFYSCSSPSPQGNCFWSGPCHFQLLSEAVQLFQGFDGPSLESVILVFLSSPPLSGHPNCL
jgi:hypothetical protein